MNRQKILAAILCGSLVLSLAGCGNHTESADSGTSSQTVSADAASDKNMSDGVTDETSSEDEPSFSKKPIEESEPQKEEKTQESSNAPTEAATPKPSKPPKTESNSSPASQSQPEKPPAGGDQTSAAEEQKPSEPSKPAKPPSTAEIEQAVAKYLNEYRIAQGDTPAAILPGLTEVARFRAKQLPADFSHNSIPDACTALQYGEYIDMTLFGGEESDSYYRGYNREAIGKGDWFGTADQMAQRIAAGFKNSSGHWAYVGDSEYSYMAVGVIYQKSEGKWYCCVCMSSENYGG